MRLATLALGLLALCAVSTAHAQVGEEEETILMNNGRSAGGMDKRKKAAIRTKGAKAPEMADDARVVPSAPVQLKGLSTVCRPGDNCTMPCPAGRCAVDCAPGSVCSATCAGGECAQRCGQGANCTFSCAGGRCAQACYSDKCKTTCEGGDCLVKKAAAKPKGKATKKTAPR